MRDDFPEPVAVRVEIVVLNFIATDGGKNLKTR